MKAPFASSLVVLLLFVWLTLFTANAQAEPPSLTVSTFALDTVKLAAPTAKMVADKLNADKWCLAKAADKGGAWNTPPRGVDASIWVSFVTVGFNEQSDVYALMFAGPDGAMSLAAHVPFRRTWMPNNTLVWIWPSETICGALRVALSRSDRKSTREPLALEVIPWEDSPGDSPTTTPKSNLKEARVLSQQQVFDPVMVMAHAAAFDAGWAPRAKAAPWSAKCEVRVEDQSCSVRLTLTGPKGKQTFVKEHVSWEAYHDYLERIFRFAQAKSGVADFAQLARGNVELLAKREDRLACLVNQELAVFDLASGKRLWTTEPSVKPRGYTPSDQFTTSLGKDGAPRLLRFAGELSELDWTTGKRTALATSGADRAYRVSANKADEVATIVGGVLRLHRGGKLAWEHKQLEPLTVGPLIVGQDVIVGDATGKLTALALGDGKQHWQSPLAPQLYGSIVASGERLFVFSNAAEALLAVNAASGKELWRRATSDVLLRAPIVIGDQLLLATKANQLLLVDAASGEVRRERHWPTWLVAVALVESKANATVACTDLAGAVTLVSLDKLETQREVALSTSLVGPIIVADKIDYRWPVAKETATGEESLVAEIKDGPTQAGPALLVTDVEGFVYILPLADRE